MMNTSTTPDSLQAQATVHEPVSSAPDHSYVPKMRRTFNFFSHKGITTEGGGVVSGALRIQLRKGFTDRTRVLVAYEDHDLFVEVQGSPLEGNVQPQVVLGVLRRTGSLKSIQ